MTTASLDDTATEGSNQDTVGIPHFPFFPFTPAALEESSHKRIRAPALRH